MIASPAAVWICLLCLMRISLPLAAAERKLSPGHVPKITRRLRAQGGLPATKQLQLSIGLPLRNTAQLEKDIIDIYDPNSPRFHHFLNPPEFTRQYGPTAAQYRAVVAYALSNHLTVVRAHPNRMVLDVRGAAGDIQKMFAVHLNTYQRPDGAGLFFAPDAEPAVKGEVPILDVTGLSDYRPPHPMIRGRVAARARANAQPNAGSGSGGAFLGNDFRAAYVPGVTLTGAGQTVGLLEFDGFYATDISAYESTAGLAHVPLQTILLDGYNGVPTSAGNAEVSLDIEMAIAMAPGLNKVVVYEAGPTGLPNDVLNRMANDNTAKELACSWTWSGGPSGTTDQIFLQMAAQGQTFFCASGDSDAYASGAIDNPSNTDSPADSPYITSVGATTLSTTGPGGGRLSESVWNWGGGTGSSGGVSSYYTIPTWQQGINLAGTGGSSSMRNIPDVAMVGDNIYVTYGNGSTGTFGGTSCAAPLWAGFIALVNQQAANYGMAPMGFLNPAIYAIGKSANYTMLMNDVVTGNNTSPASPGSYYATGGYDLCSGWGSPNGANLINALALPPDSLGVSPTNGFNVSGPIGGPFASNTLTFTLTNFGAVPIHWTLGNNCPWVSVSTTGGNLLPAGPVSKVTVALNSNANLLPGGTYTGTLWITNGATGFVTSRQFSLTPTAQLVQNGGFESGALDGWTLSGNTNYTGVAGVSSYVHSGGSGLEMGPSMSQGYLSQTIPTVAGQSYLLSFWFCNPKPTGNPNLFGVSWNGASLFAQTNIPALTWTNLRFIVRATDASTLLKFNFQNDPAYFGLDDVSVLPFAAPALQSLTKLSTSVQLSLNTTAGLVYQLQYTTDLQQNNWTDIGPPFTATNSVTTFADNTATDSQRFYRVCIHP